MWATVKKVHPHPGETLHRVWIKPTIHDQIRNIIQASPAKEKLFHRREINHTPAGLAVTINQQVVFLEVPERNVHFPRVTNLIPGDLLTMMTVLKEVHIIALAEAIAVLLPPEKSRIQEGLLRGTINPKRMPEVFVPTAGHRATKNHLYQRVNSHRVHLEGKADLKEIPTIITVAPGEETRKNQKGLHQQTRITISESLLKRIGQTGRNGQILPMTG